MQDEIENIVVIDVAEASDKGPQNYMFGVLFAFVGNVIEHFSGFEIEDERNFIAVFYPIEAGFVLRWNIYVVSLYKSPHSEWRRNVCVLPRLSNGILTGSNFARLLGAD